MGRIRRGGFPVRTRRRVGWEEGTGGTGSETVGASSSIIVGSSLAVLADGFTLVRMRGHISAFLTAVTGAGDGFTGAFGIGLATTAAIAVGVSAVPTPITEQDWDGWLYWTPFWCRGVKASSTDGANAVSGAFRQEIDSKSMRKVGESMSFYAAFEVVETGSAVMEFMHDSRMLFKLP